MVFLGLLGVFFSKCLLFSKGKVTLHISKNIFINPYLESEDNILTYLDTKGTVTDRKVFKKSDCKVEN